MLLLFIVSKDYFVVTITKSIFTWNLASILKCTTNLIEVKITISLYSLNDAKKLSLNQFLFILNEQYKILLLHTLIEQKSFQQNHNNKKCLLPSKLIIENNREFFSFRSCMLLTLIYVLNASSWVLLWKRFFKWIERRTVLISSST